MKNMKCLNSTGSQPATRDVEMLSVTTRSSATAQGPRDALC